MKASRKFTVRIFECPKCKNELYATKRQSCLTSNGHVKKMYCPYCKATVQCVQKDTITSRS